MFCIAICDDDTLDLEILRAGTEQWLKKNMGINGTVVLFRSSEELQTCILDGKEHFNLYILDIKMKKPDGIQLGWMIRRKDTDVPIIYVTSALEFALDAYAVHAIRYLIKPLKMEELYSALDISHALYKIRPRHILIVNGEDAVTSIVMEEIMYIENNLRRITYTMYDRRTVESIRRGGSFESAIGSVVSDTSFIQPHKSFFVNMKYIQVLQSDVVLMDDGREIPIARRRLSEIQEKYIRFISERQWGMSSYD